MLLKGLRKNLKNFLWKKMVYSCSLYNFRRLAWDGLQKQNFYHFEINEKFTAIFTFFRKTGKLFQLVSKFVEHGSKKLRNAILDLIEPKPRH